MTEGCYNGVTSVFDSVCGGSDDGGDEGPSCDASTPCASGTFCNMDDGGAFCESCPAEGESCDDSLPAAGQAACASVCTATTETPAESSETPAESTETPATDSTAADTTEAAAQSTVTTVLQIDGVTADNFDAAQAGIKTSLSETTGVAEENIALSFSAASGRRMLQAGSVTATFTTSDPTTVSNTISGDTFATDLSTSMANSGNAAISGFTVTQVSSPVTGTTTTTTESSDAGTSNDDPDSSVFSMSVISALVAGLALF